jgi:hypothetical protein
MIATKAEYVITPFPYILLDAARNLPVISYAPGKAYPLDQLFAEMQIFNYAPKEMASRLREVTGGLMTKGMIFCALAYLDEHPELHERIAERRRLMWRRDDIFDSVVAHV